MNEHPYSLWAKSVPRKPKIQCFLEVCEQALDRLPLPFDLGHLRYQEADLVAIEFRNRGLPWMILMRSSDAPKNALNIVSPSQRPSEWPSGVLGFSGSCMETRICFYFFLSRLASPLLFCIFFRRFGNLDAGFLAVRLSFLAIILSLIARRDHQIAAEYQAWTCSFFLSLKGHMSTAWKSFSS